LKGLIDRGVRIDGRYAGVGEIGTVYTPDKANLEDNCKQGVGHENQWMQVHGQFVRT
jgi:hypothetical protein